MIERLFKGIKFICTRRDLGWNQVWGVIEDISFGYCQGWWRRYRALVLVKVDKLLKCNILTTTDSIYHVVTLTWMRLLIFILIPSLDLQRRFQLSFILNISNERRQIYFNLVSNLDLRLDSNLVSNQQDLNECIKGDSRCTMMI